MIHFLLTSIAGIYEAYSILWNLILAMIPCWLAYALAKGVGKKKWSSLGFANQLAFIMVILLWLVFLPNTAYLFASVRYLLDYCQPYNHFRVCLHGQNLWMVLFFFLYSVVGLPLFVYALAKVTALVGRLFGKTVQQIFPIVIIPLTAMGVLFGLVERWNSWDLLHHPTTIVITGFLYLLDPERLANFIPFTLMLYILYYGADYLWRKKHP